MIDMKMINRNKYKFRYNMNVVRIEW